MVTVRRSTLRVLTICLGFLFVGGFYYFFHYRLPWDWSAPGAGHLPREIVSGFLDQSYGDGNGVLAAARYFSPDAVDNAAGAQDRHDGEPIAHEIRQIVAQGQTVVVFHRIAAARGEPSADVIDVFETNRGRIVRRQRYLTAFE